jgi:hypothetical protein
MTQLWNSTNAVHAAPQDDVAIDAGLAMLARLRAVGRRGAPSALAGAALAAYWRHVGQSAPEQRAGMLRALRAEIAAGHLVHRACLPVALGEPDFALAREAARAYLGGWPASVERREHAVADVIDWIVRGLALNRAALCCALLDGADPATLERLGTVRARLSTPEAAIVFDSFSATSQGEVRAFLDEWLASCA